MKFLFPLYLVSSAPTGMAEPCFFGGERTGVKNLFASLIVIFANFGYKWALNDELELELILSTISCVISRSLSLGFDVIRLKKTKNMKDYENDKFSTGDFDKSAYNLIVLPTAAEVLMK